MYHSENHEGESVLLSVREVARLLGVSPGYVRQLARDKQIAAFRLGSRGDLRFPVDAVKRFLSPV